MLQLFLLTSNDSSVALSLASGGADFPDIAS